MPGQDTDPIFKLLAAHPLFAELPAETLGALARCSLVSTFEKGHRLITENQAAPELFIILKGQARVTINGTEVGRLDAGELAGEISSAGISPPIADVVAATDLEALSIPRAVLNDIAADHAAFKRHLRQAAFRRIQK
jgi:signal-transduction protein with cAMP-binding, CBS, and nucleotidyltransferase domain